MTRNIVAPAAIRIQILAFNISPHFIHSKALSIFPAQGQNVIPVFVFRDQALHGIAHFQLLPHPAAGLMTGFIIIKTEQNGIELRHLFQHLQYRLNGCAATGYKWSRPMAARSEKSVMTVACWQQKVRLMRFFSSKSSSLCAIA